MTSLALSTEHFQMCGFTVLAVENSKAEAEAAAEMRLGKMVPGDFRSCTWHKNMRIVSKSEAMKRGWINRRTWGDVLVILQRLDADDLACVAALLDSHETAASAKRLIDEGKK